MSNENETQAHGAGFRLEGFNIVCFSTADWDTPLPTNKHQLMTRLARRNRVLFLETLGTRAPKLGSGTDVARIGRRLRRGLEGPRRRLRQLWTLSPVVRPNWSSPAARTLNRAAFRLQTANVMGRFPDCIAWVYSPYAVYLLDELKPRAVVYHMVDDLAAVPGADRAALREAEALLLGRADVVFCTERSLHDRARRINPLARLTPNVADYRHFSRPGDGVVDPRLAAMDALRGPRVVFSGNLAPHKVDLALLARLASLRPDWQFILVGPEWEGGAASPGLEKLRRAPNAHLLGHVPYRDLPAYLHRADALVIPYVDNEATRAVFPLKFFEYLATGRPVVASPLPSLLPYHEAVHLARGPAEWIAAIERCLADPEDLADQRRVLARRHTWAIRLAEMEAAIGEIIS